MSTISSDVYSSLGLGSATAGKSAGGESLGQADFLRLMTEQLQHQDPLNPMENSAFLGQLAQFSTVQGIQTLNSQFGNFADVLGNDQVMRGAALVGRDVMVPSARLALAEDGQVSGSVAAPGPGTVTFSITDANGLPVHEFSVPASKAGEVAFSWDGSRDNGQTAAAGSYGITATYTSAAGARSVLDTYVKGRVESATVGSEGLYLDLRGMGTVPLNQVLRIS
jgi:flagellar basal-body rod modification protein FlgD